MKGNQLKVTNQRHYVVHIPLPVVCVIFTPFKLTDKNISKYFCLQYT
jgi:hypothetical protein